MPFSEARFIFSNEPKYRISRHLVFWFAWWLFFTLIYGARPVETVDGWRILKMSLITSSVEAVLYMPNHILYSYALIYFLIPRYLLKSRYLQFMGLLVLLTLLSSVFSNGLTIFAVNPFRESLGVYTSHWSFYYGLMAGLRGGVQTGGFAATIKLMKYFYFKQKANQQLAQEKLKAELQLLKSQVHPHFLFNTLNNLYSLTLTKSDQSPEIVLKLAGLLRYMLYECDTPKVLLTSEITMLQSYIELEKLRYGQRLDISMNIQGDMENKLIAPLLLLPFVENSFKHGTSEQIDQAWISLDILVKQTSLKFKLINSKPEGDLPPEGKNNHWAGIGLTNIKKRLDLIYPGLYELKITSEPDLFIVNLILQLEQAEKSDLHPATTPENWQTPLIVQTNENKMPVGG